MSMALSIDSPERKTGEGSPAAAIGFATFVAGIVVGLGFAVDLGDEFVGGLALLSVLCIVLALLSRVAENTRKRVSAGEISYRAFFDHAVEGIFRTTPDGHYIAVNQALADIYGYSSPQTLITGLTDIGAQLYVEPGRRSEFRERMQAHDIVTDFVSEIYQRSGKRIWISENARAVRDWSGALICYEGTVEDVTEKFERERALRIALRQAEIANKMKAAFLAAMSHELKTPLNAVLGFSEIIRDEVLGPVGNPAYQEYAGDIHKSGARLLSVINDVLDVSRLEGGLLTIDARSENVHDIVDHAIKLARGITHDARKVEVDISDAMPLLHVDPRRLSQAIGNLLANALKFTPEGGTIRVAARVESDGGATLLVEDTGIGMAQETITAALEPFRQLDGTLSRRFEGAGLGLPISKSLIELHDGRLEIMSAVGIGTTIILRLPPKCVAQAPQALAG
ncbi:MAG: PAS domain S-box protein [Alphaproteobacteria bacterium]|nr:PAS domain S-box protein [Alphaproteobacteria bacterium]